MNIAVQLYTLREFLKTPAETAATLRKVKKIGFDVVELAGAGPVGTAELKNMLDGEGLICCSSHDSGKDIIDEPEKVIERLKLLDCKYAVYPYPHSAPKSEADYKRLAQGLNRSGRIFADAGMVLSYHNHAIEFERFGGRTALDIIYDESDAEFLQAEIDTYWVQYGGEDPSGWCEKLKNRLPLIHLKEYGIINNEVRMLEIGSGNLNWRKIIKAAEEAGTKWFIIEQDTCRIDPFESLKMSLKYLRMMN